MSLYSIPCMTCQQYRAILKLVHACCNYDCGNCLFLDNGEECVCPQSITYLQFANVSAPPFSLWTWTYATRCFLRPLLDGGGAGSAEGHLSHPSATRSTALPVPLTGPNAAKQAWANWFPNTRHPQFFISSRLVGRQQAHRHILVHCWLLLSASIQGLNIVWIGDILWFG